MSGIWRHTPIMVRSRESTRDSNATRLLSTLALAFLVESLVGQAFTVLIFAVIVGISISVKVRRPLLLTLATAALAVNTLYLALGRQARLAPIDVAAVDRRVGTGRVVAQCAGGRNSAFAGEAGRFERGRATRG